MSMKVVGIDKLCGITVVSITVNLRKHYAVWVMMSNNRLVNADIQTDDLHEIIYTEESLEGMFPGIMNIVRTA